MMSSACQNRFEAHQAAQGIGAEALDEDLRHHRAEPKEPGADMQPVQADDGKQGRQEGAAVGAGAEREWLAEQFEGFSHPPPEGSLPEARVGKRSRRRRPRNLGPNQPCRRTRWAVLGGDSVY
jgi:hypothetical protein